MTLSTRNRLQQRLMRLMFWFSTHTKRNWFHPLDISVLNHFLTQQLPTKQMVTVPVGHGELHINSAQFSVKNERLIITAYCYLNIHALSTSLYQASIKIVISGCLGFCDNNKYIRLNHPQIETLELKDDHYPITHATTSWLNKLFSRNQASIIFSGVEHTLNFFSGQTYDEAKRYLSMYINGNKQKILDYHRTDIQTSLEEMLSHTSHWYRLDPENFEEKMLIEYGRTIKVQQGQLRIYWN